jgi:hypothetical protein
MKTFQCVGALGLAASVAGCGSAPTGPSAGMPKPATTTHNYDGGQLTLNSTTNTCTVRLQGEINHSAVRRLGPLLQQVEQAGCRSKRLVLHATQGVLGDAVTLGAMLRNRHYDTEVGPGTRCETPCLLVFAAGHARVLAPSSPPSRLVFTQIPPDQDFGRGVCSTELSRGQQLTLTRYLRAMLPADTATAVYHKLQAADCQRSDAYGPAEALALGLATTTR